MFEKQIKSHYLLLFIFPLIFIIIQILLKIEIKYFFLTIADPVYAYLFNGLQVAQGNFETGLILHPGIIMHYFMGLNIFIIHLFRINIPIAQDVITNSEFYLSIISYEIIALNAIALFLLGYKSYKNYKNIALSCAVQLTPFISLQGISSGSVIMLEPFLLLIEILLLTIISKYAFNISNKISFNDVLFFSLLMGAGIAAKIVFIPLIFLPFFLIEKIRGKITYLLMIFVFFVVIIIPFYKVLPYFFNWIKNIFLHTGNYGSGELGIINAKNFVQNLRLAFSHNYIFSAGFLLILLTVFFILLPKYRQNIKSNDVKVLSGLLISLIINLIMTSKHYSEHYLIISHNLIVFGILLSVFTLVRIDILKQWQTITNSIKTIIVFNIGLVLLVLQI
jgi:hypothetical protein